MFPMAGDRFATFLCLSVLARRWVLTRRRHKTHFLQVFADQPTPTYLRAHAPPPPPPPHTRTHARTHARTHDTSTASLLSAGRCTFVFTSDLWFILHRTSYCRPQVEGTLKSRNWINLTSRCVQCNHAQACMQPVADQATYMPLVPWLIRGPCLCCSCSSKWSPSPSWPFCQWQWICNRQKTTNKQTKTSRYRFAEQIACDGQSC